MRMVLEIRIAGVGAAIAFIQKKHDRSSACRQVQERVLSHPHARVSPPSRSRVLALDDVRWHIRKAMAE